jgi:hypothetical protein
MQATGQARCHTFSAALCPMLLSLMFNAPSLIVELKEG